VKDGTIRGRFLLCAVALIGAAWGASVFASDGRDAWLSELCSGGGLGTSKICAVELTTILAKEA